MKLLTTNTKISKNEKLDMTGAGLSLAPGKHSGYEVCPERGACYSCCILYYGGFTIMNNVRQAMINKTKWLFEDRKTFLAQLHKELGNFEKKKNPVIRLNVGSDLNWLDIDETLFKYNIQYYDYTKVFSRWKDCVNGKYPSNYNIVYSWNEKSDKRAVNALLKKGGNINMVHNTRYNNTKDFDELPSKITIGTKTWDTVDGDLVDARLKSVDGESKAILVRFKGTKRKDREKYIKSGFVVDGVKI